MKKLVRFGLLLLLPDRFLLLICLVRVRAPSLDLDHRLLLLVESSRLARRLLWLLLPEVPTVRVVPVLVLRSATLSTEDIILLVSSDIPPDADRSVSSEISESHDRKMRRDADGGVLLAMAVGDSVLLLPLTKVSSVFMNSSSSPERRFFFHGSSERLLVAVRWVTGNVSSED